MSAPFTIAEMNEAFVLNYMPSFVSHAPDYQDMSEVILINGPEDIVVQSHEPPPRPVTWDRRSIPTLQDAIGGTHRDTITSEGAAIRFSIWGTDARRRGMEYVASIARAAGTIAQNSIMRQFVIELNDGFSTTVSDGNGATTTFYSNSHLRGDGTSQDNLTADALNPDTLHTVWTRGANWTDWGGNDLGLGTRGSTLFVDNTLRTVAEVCIGPVLSFSTTPIGGGGASVMPQIPNPMANRGIRVKSYNFASVGATTTNWFLAFDGLYPESRPMKVWVQREPSVIMEWKPTEDRYEVLLTHEMTIKPTAPTGNVVMGNGS